ncbi:YesL family protein [Bacillus sp. FSL K6-3431]|uniref:YesL family protein n=1 Tax=Bacillus sp. FSL K6-3431 TaxID=2921500 RepID=UPI0030F9E864
MMKIGKLYQLSEWAMKLALVNLLWLLYSVLGLLIFSLFPATSAMFYIIRKWLIGETEIPLWKTFHQQFKSDFKQINIIGVLFFLIGLLLFIDVRFFISSHNPLLNIAGIFVLLVVFIYAACLIYIFPIYVHYQLRTLEYLKSSFIIALGRPIQTFLMILGVAVIGLLFKSVPGLIPFFSGSFSALILMKVASISFETKPSYL